MQQKMVLIGLKNMSQSETFFLFKFKWKPSKVFYALEIDTCVIYYTSGQSIIQDGNSLNIYVEQCVLVNEGIKLIEICKTLGSVW